MVNEKDKEIPSDAGYVGIVNSENITIKDLTLTNNYHGVMLAYADNTKIENINVSDNYFGIFLYNSSNNDFANNKAVDNEYGLYLLSSSNNTFTVNEVRLNKSHGITFSRSSDNKIYRNNLIDNQSQAFDYKGSGNLFDDGYPSGGNYWSDYTGVDEKSGPNQDQEGPDGIGDTPYSFTDGQDNYPFIKESGWEAPPPALPDLSISEIKPPVQVVWDSDINGDGKIDLVAGKSTMVRVEVGKRDYEALDMQELVEVRLTFDGADYTESRTIEQLEQNSWIDFYPASPAKTGDQTIAAKVDPENKIVESDETNNGSSTEITIKDTNGLYLVYIPVNQTVDYSGYGPMDLTEYLETSRQSGKFISATYPVAEEEFTDQVVEDLAYYGSTTKFIGMIKDAMKIARWGELLTRTLADRSVGIVPDDYFEYHDVIPGIDVGDWRGKSYFAITGVLARAGYWATPAHEIGHTYGLGHVKEEYNIYGFWVAEKKLIENRACFMSSSPDWHTLDYTWVEDENYNQLFKKFRADKTDPEVLLVSGLIFKDGRIELENWYRLEEGIVDDVMPGDYSIQILGTNGQMLNNIPFYAPFETYVTPEGIIEADVTGFAFVIPYPTTTLKIQIQYKGKPLIELNSNSKLLRDAIDSIPDHGFIKNANQLRKTLHNKVNAFEKMLEVNNIKGARSKLEQDIKDKIEKWLIDGYQKENPEQLSKVEVIELVDEIIHRLGLM